MVYLIDREINIMYVKSICENVVMPTFTLRYYIVGRRCMQICLTLLSCSIYNYSICNYYYPYNYYYYIIYHLSIIRIVFVMRVIN